MLLELEQSLGIGLGWALLLVLEYVYWLMFAIVLIATFSGNMDGSFPIGLALYSVGMLAWGIFMIAVIDFSRELERGHGSMLLFLWLELEQWLGLKQWLEQGR